jgi:MerR family copper efflux transcriptional regulator
MRIGELAEQAGVTTKAIRYYERIGVLPAAARTEAGYRRYEPDTLTRLRFVAAAQAVGLSLGEIREVIAFRDRGEAPCGHVLELIARRAGEIGARIEELGRLRAELVALAERGRGLDPAACGPDGICHVIEPVRGSPR